MANLPMPPHALRRLVDLAVGAGTKGLSDVNERMSDVNDVEELVLCLKGAIEWFRVKADRYRAHALKWNSKWPVTHRYFIGRCRDYEKTIARYEDLLEELT